MRYDITRRQFLHATGMGLGGLLVAGCSRGGEAGAGAESAQGAGAGGAAAGSTARTAGDTAASGGARVSHISVQLYTLRNLVERDMAGTLKSLADIGYREVEFAGYYDKTPQQVRAMLDGAGLTAPSAHVPIADLRGDIGKVLSAAETIGHRYVICPWVEAPTTVEGWRALATEFTKFGTAAQQRGLQFAYHNHDFEFKPVGGKLPYDVILESTDPKLVQMELDLFWAVKAGQDPVTYFQRHPGRFPLVHVKDMRDLRGAQQMVDVGTGDIDFRSIFAHAEHAGIVHYVVEHDQPADALASVRTSYGNLRRMLA